MLDDTLKRIPHKTVGMKQTRRALEKNQVVKVYLAQDAEAHVIAPIQELAKAQQVEVVEVPSMSELGKACGIEVGAAVVGILKQ